MKQGDLFGGGAPPPKKERPAEPSKAAAPVAAPVVAPPPPAPVAAPVAAPERPLPAWRQVAQVTETVSTMQVVTVSQGQVSAPQVRHAPTRQAPKVLSVSAFTRAIKDSLEPQFGRVLVQGEVSGFRGPNSRGHLYFALKDDGASLDVKVWQSTAARFRFALKDGLQVVAEGSLDLYEPAGRYSLIANRLEPSGLGALALAYEQLKAKLAAEGLFGPKRTKPKRALPRLPRRVGVVTSVSGAALKDFLQVLHRRHPKLAVLVANTRVQGDGASIEIARAIHRLGLQAVDLIVVTRGGGSVEDLWAFNEEPVARAIFQSPVPVVSAVGHEIDTTLADYVADVRAPTPSAAAEAVAPVLAELEAELATAKAGLQRALRRRLAEARGQLDRHARRLSDPRRLVSRARLELADLAEAQSKAFRDDLRERREGLAALTARLQQARPQARLSQTKTELRQLATRLERAMRSRAKVARAELQEARSELLHHSPKAHLREAKAELRQLTGRLAPAALRAVQRRRDGLGERAGKLHALSPLAVLGRGYAIAQTQGRVIRSAEQVHVGDRLEVRLDRDDVVEATVTATRPGKR